MLTRPLWVKDLSDQGWFDMLVKSISTPVVNGLAFPGFPPKEMQTQFVGSSDKKTLGEAFAFYRFVKESAQKWGTPIGPKSRFLDFGCGWGRYMRFFWKDVDVENLYGCDVNAMIVETCRNLNIPGQVSLIDPHGKLPYPDSYFDTIMAYSVFTHLPETVNLHWMRELARVARPGCVFCLTLEPRRFIDFIKGIPKNTDSVWYQKLSAHKPRLMEFYRTFDSGNLAFMPTHEGCETTYGDVVIPLSFIERAWGTSFKVHIYIDDPTRFWQAALVVSLL